MISFACDYLEGAHEKVLRALCETNSEQSAGYGYDAHCEHAAAMIRERCGAPDAAVHFFVGGTQVNMTAIAAALRPHEGAVCADSGHINVHESGAIEASGHKVLPLPSENGKITAAQVDEFCRAWEEDDTREHIVRPRLVYLSQPTECGTLYSKAELAAMRATCREHGLLLYIDGARLAYGLGAAGNDVTLRDLAECADAFTLGGTKCGALFGEALVLTNKDWDRDFFPIQKQRGAVLAKGRLLGVQFETLLQDDLYETIGREADARAYRLRDAFLKAGVPMLFDSPTNQQFPILTDEQAARLSENFGFSAWQNVDENRRAVRFCTSWATTDEQLDELIRVIENL